MSRTIDVLIPTYDRPAALAVTLTSLIAQTNRDFRLVISDQTENEDVIAAGEVRAVLRVLTAHGHPLEVYKNLPRRGMAEQRQFLLNHTRAPYTLFIDDDLILEPYVIQMMLKVIKEESCGFVGSAAIGLSSIDDVRPHEQAIELWEEPVRPEVVRPRTPEWERHKLHNAANLYHAQRGLRLTPESPRKYRVAWVGACALYDTAKLRSVGGFTFWKELPVRHCGEDVLVQLRLMARYGGCGVIPSGVYHQELQTTVPDRGVNAPEVLDLESPEYRLKIGDSGENNHAD
jgi:GT2 family glycosyltransferase